jgi:hypothetical protein
MTKYAWCSSRGSFVMHVMATLVSSASATAAAAAYASEQALRGKPDLELCNLRLRYAHLRSGRMTGTALTSVHMPITLVHCIRSRRPALVAESEPYST